jgi:hypothetical protein
MLLCTTTDDKLIHAFGIVQQKYNNRKQRKTFQNFQNEMRFPLLHYTSKHEKKGHECCYSKLPIERK